MEINISDLKDVLDFIINNFNIRYEDFEKDKYRVYKKRKILGFVRFDQKEIYFDQGIHNKVEEETWAHEALSIYYYQILNIIRHDDEIEEQAKELCRNPELSNILREYINKVRSR